MDYPKVSPLFNYIGGKTWLRDTLREEVDLLLTNNTSNITHYTEPFSGGLGAFLGIYDILIKHGVSHITLNDINQKIINFYKQVKTNYSGVVASYMILEQQFIKTIPTVTFSRHKTKEKNILKTELQAAETYYKTVRKTFNTTQTDVDSAAHLLFLQNHCFNGVYRENSKGEYNTPFNWEAKTFTQAKIDEKIKAVIKVFSYFQIEFSNKPFQELTYNKETLYYLDPPYINEDISENKYNKDAFSVKHQELLIEKIKDSAFIYSNHNHPLLQTYFKKHLKQYSTKQIPRKNIISASASSRAQDKIEILVVHTNES